MAKKETTTAAPENNAQSQDTTLDTSFENLKKGNLISQSVNEKALEEIAKSKEENQIRIAKNAIKEAEYNNLKTVIRLRNQRRLAKIDKKLADDTLELLQGLVGKKDDKGKFVAGTLTPTEYEKKKEEIIKAANDERNKVRKVFQEETSELQGRFPDYWCYENDWDRKIYSSRW